MSRASTLPGQSAPWRFILNTGIVLLGALLSRVLGFVREAVFAAQFGVAPELSAFRAAFTIPDLLYFVVIGGALGSALIPVFSRLVQDEREATAWELANTILTVSFVVFLALALVVAIFARPLLVFTVARGYADNQYLLNLTVRLMRLMLIQPLLLGLGGLMMAILQTYERFTLPAVAFNVYNLSIIAAALLLAPRFGIVALPIGVVGGALLYFLVQVPGVVRAGLRFKPSFNMRMWEVRRVGRLLAPRLIGQSALQINIIVMASLMGLLGESALAANGYAYQLLMLPHGILAVSLATVMFPRLTRMYAANDLDALSAQSMQTLRLVLWLTVPAAVLMALLHLPIVRLLFQRGEFNLEALNLTRRAFLFYTPGAIGLAGAEIVIRTFYAMENTRTPVIVGVASIVLNALLAWSLITFVARDIGLIALSYSVTNVLEFVVLLTILLARLHGFRAAQLWRSALTIGASTVGMAALVIGSIIVWRGRVPGITLDSAYGRGGDFFVLAIWLMVTAAIGSGVYLLISVLLRAPEVREVWALVRRRKAGS